MKAVIVLTLATLAAVLGAKPEEVKTQAAGAHYGGSPQYSNNQPQYGFWQPLLQDRFVCDLDASVLLVVDHNRHHRHSYFGGPSANRAVRVKCSEVANNDEDSCNFCCQQTARRDTSLPNEKLFGFLAITKTKDEETFTRNKRDADTEEDEEDERRRRNGGRFHKVDSTFVNEGKWTPDDYDTNVKCVCCAPRPTITAQSPSTYNNAAASPPVNTYNNAAQSPSTYNTAAASPPVNTYNNAAQNPSSYTVGSGVAPQPVPVVSSDSLVDSWQSDDVTSSSSSSWGAAANDAAPAVTPSPNNNY